MVVGVALGVLLLLSSCAGAGSGAGTRAADPSPDAVVPSVEGEPCPLGQPVAGGEVLAREQISDARGDYCAVTPAPDAPAMQLDEAVVRFDALLSWDFSVDDAVVAQQRAVTFVVEEVLDSSLLDTEGAVADWFAATPYRFVDFAPSDGVVVHDLAPLARDGAPRASELRVRVTLVTAQGGKAGPRALVVRTEADARFRPENDGAEIELQASYQLFFTEDGGIIGYSYSYDVGD